MTNRTFYLLLAAGCGVACGVAADYAFSAAPVQDRGTSRLLTAVVLFAAVAGLYCLVLAFDRRQHRFGGDSVTFVRLACPYCGGGLNHSKLPAFRKQFPCPRCGEVVERGPLGLLARPRFLPPPAE